VPRNIQSVCNVFTERLKAEPKLDAEIPKSVSQKVSCKATWLGKGKNIWCKGD